MTTQTWKPTACILCECNCGIEIRLGGEHGRRFVGIRGDKRHPASQGYFCQKATRLDHYQNNRDRITVPLRRRADGTFEDIDWQTAIGEVARRLASIRDLHGGDKIFYYGGGGQGNHLPGAYSGATLHALGAIYRSNALAQEKTGEFWVADKMLSATTRGDFEHCEVAVFIGKNPWQSHSIPRARATLREIAKDPTRSMVVIDSCRSETADLADFHLQVRPGKDAWLLAAMCAIVVQEGLLKEAWLSEHTSGLDEVLPFFRNLAVGRYCEIAGVPQELVRKATRRIASAESAAFFEDLGVQMAPHSTLASYLDRLLWLFTGNFAKPGAQYIPAIFRPLLVKTSRHKTQSPVVGARIISGLVPCNAIADEILTDHPARYRAMIVESANPAHSLADSQRMRKALRALDLLVVIDVAMSETARLADYVLPTPTQYEKWEATFFNFDFPRNCFHLRRPILDPPPGVLPEPEIHARLVEALGVLPEQKMAELRQALREGRRAFAAAFLTATQQDADLRRLAPVVLYRTLGPTLPHGAASAAVLWAAAHLFAMLYPHSARRAGFSGEGLELGEAIFEAIMKNSSGTIFAVDDYEESFRRIGTSDGRINLAIPELFDELAGLAAETRIEPPAEFPFVLSAGERRSFTANTILRDPAWRKQDRLGALRMSPADAAKLGLGNNSRARLVTKRGAVEVVIEISDRMQPGHVSLPNGLGLDYPQEDGTRRITGASPNELTATEDRDWLAGTPWHKHVAARIEPVATA